MSPKENEIFSRLRGQCATPDEILHVSGGGLELTCKPAKPLFREPDEPEVLIAIRNVSDSEIVLLEPRLEVYKPDYSVFEWPKQPDRKFVFTLNNRANVVHLLSPGETLTVPHRVQTSGYGEFKIKVVLPEFRIDSMTTKSMSWDNSRSIETTCSGVWER
jgi:hypothetical protein